MMDPKRTAMCFNEWMRRYIADPEGFNREFQTVAEFVAEQNSGVPSYGAACAAYLEKLNAELA